MRDGEIISWRAYRAPESIGCARAVLYCAGTATYMPSSRRPGGNLKAVIYGHRINSAKMRREIIHQEIRRSVNVAQL